MINSLIASLFVYKMMVLPCIPPKVVEAVNGAIIKYLWNGHKPKIPLEVLQLNRTEGGLQLVDLVRKDDSLKVSWVCMIWDGQYPEKIPHQTLHEIGKCIWMCNLAAKDVEVVCSTTNQFWKDVFKGVV